MIHCSLDRLKMHNTLNLPTPRTGRQEDENLIIKFMWPYGLLHSAKPYDVIRQMLQQGVMSVAKMQQQSEKHGRVIEDVTVIFDLEKLSIQRHLWKPGIEVTCRGFNLFEANFPEILKAVYILKASKIFPVAWGIVKPFVEEKTRKKVNVLGANWQEELRKHIAPDQLPEYYGGKCRDANDDPKCAEHICYGGDIPHSYYSSQCDRASDSLNATDISISRGSRHTVDVEVTKPLSVIRWEFQTDSHDIGFGLFFKGQVDSSISMSVDEMDEMVSIKRWDCHRVPEDGHFVAELVGTYVICFDNSHSWLRTKNVRFVVDVLDPVKMDEEDEVLS
ncbi:SEC14-like protein 2 isoform X2 [Corticium candelabrum]|uniref:SEC14-like protein 2 isoform X2 n=1 Tax=Corticium candelabrum TaxID=121492 RepID=UPI002E252218|nr:SEC14-like protein 2 isoform X2 [Corticium candelabrum]